MQGSAIVISCHREMVVILMGVSGSGKTTLGLRLASDLGWTFVDADDLRSTAHAEKMARGESPSDQDLEDWATIMQARVAAAISSGENAVVAYSALKSGHRHRLTIDQAAVRFVYLKGSASLVRRRLRNRSGHFLREGLLSNEFAALEEPQDAVVVDIEQRPGLIVDQIRQALSL
jgi:gluconokinase